MQRERGQRGFTLLEVAIALTVLMIALLGSLALALQQPRVVKRIDATREVVRVLEWTAEEMRAQIIPLADTDDVGWTLSPTVVGGAPPDLKISVRVTPAPGTHLYDVVLVGRYSVLGQHRTRRMETLFWRPGGVP